MKISSVPFVVASLTILVAGASCDRGSRGGSAASVSVAEQGQASVSDDVSRRNILQVAAGSKDHTTLVAALKAAELTDVLANPGPFTVFAPSNEAFAKLPKGTLESLLKPGSKAELQNILQYHVTTSAIAAERFRDGQKLGEANGDSVVVSVKDGKVSVNGTHIVASIPASNGMIHIIDAVLLPPAH